MVFERGHLMGKDYFQNCGFVVSFLLEVEEGTFFRTNIGLMGHETCSDLAFVQQKPFIVRGCGSTSLL